VAEGEGLPAGRSKLLYFLAAIRPRAPRLQFSIVPLERPTQALAAALRERLRAIRTPNTHDA
jgi:hypothetical protein